MAHKAEGNRVGLESALADCIELLGKAILSGIAAGVVLAVVTLGLAATASAQTQEVDTYPSRVPDLHSSEPIVDSPAHPTLKATIVVSSTRGNLPWSMAPTPSPSSEPTVVGALWAKARIASLMDEPRLGADEIAQTDAESTLQIMLGLLALATAGMVVLVGRFAPAGGAPSLLCHAESKR